MSGITLNINSKLDETGLKSLNDWLKKNDEAQKASKESGGALKQGFGELKGELLGFASVFGVVDFFKSCIEESSKLEEATALLAHSINNTGVSASKYMGQVDQLTSALAEQTRFSKTESMEALNQMVQRTGDLGTAEHLLGDAMGLAVAQHKSLAETSNMLALATTGNERAFMQLGRAMGLTKDQMQDHAFVMAEIHKRYGDLAQSEDTFASKQAKLSHSFDEFKTTIGSGLMPILSALFTGITRGVNSVIPILQLFEGAVFDFIIQPIHDILGVLSSIPKIGGAFKSAYQTIDEMQKANNSMMKEEGKKLVDALSGEMNKMPELVAPVHKKMQQDDDKANADKVKHMKLTYDQLLALAAKHQINLAKLNKEDAKTFADGMNEKTAVEQEGGAIIGKLAAESMTNQQNAYKDALGSIIDMIAQKTEAAIMAYALEGAANSIATYGPIAGGAMAAAEMGLGAAAAAAVGGLASAAKSALGGGGAVSTSAASTAGEALATGISPAANKESGAGSKEGGSGTNINLIVQGNILGEKQYVQTRLLPMLSSAVEDYGGRLVASRTK